MRARTSAPSAQPIRLSACLIVKDEEQRLPECLASVAFCDEVVVVDSGSTDRTREIARAAGAVVIEQPWKGFAAQRNVALDAARGEWALEVDADERITPALRDQIVALVSNPPPDVDNGVLPLRQVFLGYRLGPSALYPAGRTRLFRRANYRHDDRRVVHEGLWPAGRSAYLDGDLEHLLSESLGESVRDLRAYTRLESRHLQADGGARAAILGVAIRPAAKFVYRSWLLGGWRDGWAGITKILLDCLYDSLTWIRYLRSRRRLGRDGGGEPHNEAAPTAGQGHFGHAVGYRGPVRVVAVAHGRAQAAVAHRWLEAAAHEGADVVLITDAGLSSSAVRTVEVERFGALIVLRAIAVEVQRNPIEVLVCSTRRVQALCRLLPAQLRGFSVPGSLEADPRELIEGALSRRPGSGARSGS
jgi:glycosyltransferase involved in cell wall biosynthesis